VTAPEPAVAPAQAVVKAPAPRKKKVKTPMGKA